MIDSLKAITYKAGVYKYRFPREYVPQTSLYFVVPSNPVSFAAPSGLRELRAFSNIRESPAVTSGGGSRTVVPNTRAYVRMRNPEIPDIPLRLSESMTPPAGEIPTIDISTTPDTRVVDDRSPCPLCK